jgi:GNAT superfamily N-acetyltransferase
MPHSSSGKFFALEASTSGSFEVSPLKVSDFQDASRLLTSVFGGTRDHTMGCFAHWWELNPAWSSTIPRGWFIRSSERAPIAFTANIPFNYIIGGQPGLCCATGSLAVHSDWRGQGLSKLVGRAFVNQCKPDLLIGTDSTDVAYKLWLSLGMRPLERGWPESSYRIVGDLTAWDGPHLPPSNSGTMSGAARLRLAKSLQSERLRRKSLLVYQIEKFEERDVHDVDKCRASSASTYAVRDIQTLNWLYFGSKFVRHSRAVFVARSGKQLVGYLAMKRSSNSFYLLECRCLNADAEIARELLLVARGFAERQRAFYITVWQYTQMIEQAIPLTLSIPSRHPRMMTYCYIPKVTAFEPSSWETTPGDGDVSVN